MVSVFTASATSTSSTPMLVGEAKDLDSSTKSETVADKSKVVNFATKY